MVNGGKRGKERRSEEKRKREKGKEEREKERPQTGVYLPRRLNFLEQKLQEIVQQLRPKKMFFSTTSKEKEKRKQN